MLPQVYQLGYILSLFCNKQKEFKSGIIFIILIWLLVIIGKYGNVDVLDVFDFYSGYDNLANDYYEDDLIF